MQEQDVMTVQKLGSCEFQMWSSLSFFSEKKYRDLSKAMETLKDTKVDSKPTWNALFHACHLLNDPPLQERIATQYSMKFGTTPPVFDINMESAGGENKVTGDELQVYSMSKDESEGYIQVFEKSANQKRPLMIRFLAKKPNQLLGVTSPEGVLRLHTGIQELIKRKIPVYFDGMVVLEYLKLMLPEKRTAEDWKLLFTLFTMAGQEESFEESAVDYAVATGVSPPSWSKLSYPPVTQFFGEHSESSGKLKEQELDNGSIMIELVGSLLSSIDALSAQLNGKNFNVLVLDMKRVPHACWKAASVIQKMHEDAVRNKKKIMVVDPMPLVQEMLMALGFPEGNIIFQKKKV